ncbi:nucleoside diphosphate kinase 6-like isoform X2 [Apostichopus japonicus]|uniref:nucleoside diphosphate kinase 6-like isoform X2 n=1 Tax=Stichopus japonicus TaxID=307972 RepID=UPI003AB8352B
MCTRELEEKLHASYGSERIEIKDTILRNKFLFVRSKIVRWSKADAELFYREHKGRFFYNRLVGFMSSGSMSAHILAKEDAISHWRKLMGPTKTFKAKHMAPTTLRARFGLTDTRNATHGSDSTETAEREIGFFFPEFSLSDWYANDEPLFRTGSVRYKPEDRVHIVYKNMDNSVLR